MINYHKLLYPDFKDTQLRDRCEIVTTRLISSSPISDLERLNEAVTSKDASMVLDGILDAVKRNQPEAALDRLHTFVVSFVRERCKMHDIQFEKGEPLHNIFGKYVSALQSNLIVETRMASTILRQGVKILDTFNDVRNNHSSAHPNKLLTQSEALLILGWVRGIVDFVLAVDRHDSAKTNTQLPNNISDEDLPF